METKIIKVTPTIAESWLIKNINNRKVSENIVRDYVQEMLAGNWKTNGESIKFDRKGNLIDGQHRLTAIVKSRVTVDCVIVTGLDPEAFDTVDIGKGRSTADTLCVKHVPNFKRVASALPVITAHDEGVGRKVTKHIKPSHVVRMLQSYADLPDAIEEIGKIRPLVVVQSLFDGLYYLFRRHDQKLALEYMQALRDGVGIETLNCWHRLRERLLKNKVGVQKMENLHVCALIIKGWNCARSGTDAKKLSWDQNKEEYPEIV